MPRRTGLAAASARTAICLEGLVVRFTGEEVNSPEGLSIVAVAIVPLFWWAITLTLNNGVRMVLKNVFKKFYSTDN